MALFKIKNNEIQPIQRTTFSDQNIYERNNLQEMLKKQIEIISPDTLIISEEFSYWEDSRKRIDLLGIDNNANLIVIELKRTEDGCFKEDSDKQQATKKRLLRGIIRMCSIGIFHTFNRTQSRYFSW